MKGMVERRHRLFSVIMFSGLFLAVAPTAAAQTAQVTGRVTDSQGAVIQGADLTLTNVNTGAPKTAVSNEEGIYTIPFVPPGQYRMAVKMTGFKLYRHEGFTLSVDQVARLDFNLEVGAIAEEMIIVPASPLLERETSSVGQVIENKTIVTLPLNGRNYSQLVALMPGAMPDQFAQLSPAGNAPDAFNLNGNRALQNTFLIDGMDNNNHLTRNSNVSTQALRPSIDAIQEFRVESANYSAEYGRSAGGVISVVIKSGTNQFHGSAFEFLRNDKLNANEFFANRNRLERAPLRFNQFGGTLGGPILRRRLFFFGSYQGTREHRPETTTATLPTPEMARGNFGSVNIYDPLTGIDPLTGLNRVRQQFPNNTIPEDRMDAVGRRLAALYPAPNRPGTVNNYVASIPFRDHADQYDVRLDHNLKASNSLFVRYSRSDRNTNQSSLFGPPGNGMPRGTLRDVDAQSVVGGVTQIFSDSLANEIRAGYTQNEYNQQSLASRSYYEEFGIEGVPPFEGLTGLPTIGLTGVTGLGDNNLTPDKRQAQVIQVGDNLSWIHGRHSSKFGAEAWFRKRFHRALGGARGVFSFNGRFTSRTGASASPENEGSVFADLLLGQTSSTRLSTNGTANFRDRYYGFYGTDTWKFTPRLTLNLGLRYELHTPVWEADDRMSFFDFDRTSPNFGTLVLAAGGSLRSRTFSNLDTNNFAPRIGFAYQINARTVMRGGFGVFYGSRGFENIIESGAFNPPYTIDRMVATPNNAPVTTIVLADGFPDGWLDPANALNPTVYTQPADFPWPEVYQWNLNVQRELFGSMVLSLAYVGSSAAHLNSQTDINQPPPGAGNPNLRRPFPSFGTIKLQSDFAHSTYHAFQTKLEHRFTQGFSLLASYTWSHSIDNAVAIEDYGAEAGGSFYSQDPSNTSAEKASSSFDLRHRFVTSFIYELPIGRSGHLFAGSRLARAVLGGWQVGGIMVFQGGAPMTPLVTRTDLPAAAIGGNPWRPDRLRDGNLPEDQRSVDRWFDVGAFARSAGFTLGNSGRNVLRAPGLANLDLLIGRNFAITESTRLELRGEFFNFTNSVHLGRPNTLINGNQPGVITDASSPNRQVQLGVRLVF